jgi:mannose-6-phosphate isomerase class I
VLEEWLRHLPQEGKRVLVLETYPAVRQEEILAALRLLDEPLLIIRAETATLEQEQLKLLYEPYLTDDRVFGRMAPFILEQCYDIAKLTDLRAQVTACSEGLVVVIGFGASLVAEGDLRVYADLARWEIQQRYRSQEFGNWQLNNADEEILRKYKCGFFVEWRMADRLKQQVLPLADYYLDTHIAGQPRMVTGAALMEGLRQTAAQPFRLVPYFDPGVWGGTWLAERMELPTKVHPYAWGFDGVPEENSLFFAYGGVRIELPAINLVLFEPLALLGEAVYARFGAEFPIRFDFLDTIGGQNLSLQVHPSESYIRQQFGMAYTQDESYYILDAAPGAEVYLGLKEGVQAEELATSLTEAASGSGSFPANQFVNSYPAQPHDHFLIPAGTIHCSGQNCLILEVSATPYIFTFKLWDWNRLGLDGLPRPVHLEHGLRNIRWERTTEWVERELIGRVEPVAEGEGWREERTGLHETGFIETRRHWFSVPVRHVGNGSVQVLNLVAGEEAVVESPTGAFEPFTVRYAETFIIPAAIAAYTIRPSDNSSGQTLATLKAYVRL